MTFNDLSTHIENLSISIRTYYREPVPDPNPPPDPTRPSGQTPCLVPQSELDLEEFLKTLTPGVLTILITIILMAEGEFPAQHILNGLERARSRFPTPRHAIKYLMYEPDALAGKFLYGYGLLEDAPPDLDFFSGNWPDTRKPITRFAQPALENTNQ